MSMGTQNCNEQQQNSVLMTVDLEAIQIKFLPPQNSVLTTADLEAVPIKFLPP